MIQNINPNETLQAEEIEFTSDIDWITWRWEKSGLYTSKSAYKILAEGGKVRWFYKAVWKCKAQPTARIFTYLMLQGKTLTRDMLCRRGMNLPLNCAMCDNCPVESSFHVLFLCPYATHVWFEVARTLGKQIFKPALTISRIWKHSWRMVQAHSTMTQREWTSRFICIVWRIWKQRNAVVFGDQRLPPRILANRCTEEMKMWLKFC